jgi:2-C-methyl-D-erythritol 2,4-cyclodiphosphate synthase
MNKIGLGICSHRFLSADSTKPCVIAGITFDDTPGFQNNSDGDVVFFALCHAVTTVTGVEIIGELALKLYQLDGITDSEIYLREALLLLGKQKITQVVLSLEAKRPHFRPHIQKMKENLSRILSLPMSDIGISSISGDGLTDVACGNGVRCTAQILVTSVCQD